MTSLIRPAKTQQTFEIKLQTAVSESLRAQKANNRENPAILASTIAKMVAFMQDHKQFIVPDSFKNLCKFAEQGNCGYAEKCKHAHSEALVKAANIRENPRYKLHPCNKEENCPFTTEKCRYLHLKDPNEVDFRQVKITTIPNLEQKTTPILVNRKKPVPQESKTTNAFEILEEILSDHESEESAPITPYTEQEFTPVGSLSSKSIHTQIQSIGSPEIESPEIVRKVGIPIPSPFSLSPPAHSSSYVELPDSFYDDIVNFALDDSKC